MSVLSKPYFHDEAEAFRHLESVLWPEGPVCPHCGSISGKHYDLRKTRLGLRKCSDCRKQFTVKVGTVFESAHIPLNKMLQAVYLMCGSKKGISAHQLHRVLGVTYKSAWFLCHRIREAMRDGSLAPMGGAGGVVEIDETYLGRLEGQPVDPRKHPTQYRNTIMTLVERGGSARSFHVESVSIAKLQPIIRENLSREATMHADEWVSYRSIGKEFAAHETVNHKAKEYALGTVTTNTVDGYFSIFKRGMKGTYQHCGEKHLHRYLAEFDFRYNDRIALGVEAGQRAGRALSGITGKPLKYNPINSEQI
ncbi:MAG: IS1595 family transposase [Methylobacteriaceae bacterium]|nr:IS1595 family transposase [Methylobacteriaceae bacterium]